MNFHAARGKWIVAHAACFAAILCLPGLARALAGATERVFPQPKTMVEDALKSMRSNLSGHLPTLEGFATAPSHSLDQYQRGYFQVNVQIAPIPSGGSLVHVSAKITAWYMDPAGSHSGYQLLKSNGRIEADFLDQLADQLALNAQSPENAPQPIAPTVGPAAKPAQSISAGSAPAAAGHQHESPTSQPGTSVATGHSQPSTNDGRLISAPAPKLPDPGTFSSSLSQGLAEEAAAPRNASIDKTDNALEAEAQGLEEILKNQAHPKNLVAVKKSGTPVVEKPSLTAKTFFLASMHDEFEMLDFNGDWVHVRISGLSRGWIWRDSVEMPEGIPDTITRAPAPVAAADLFHVVREEAGQFPGDWPALRGKNVKILTIQKIDENAKTGGPQDKLEFSKYLLDKTYTELTSQERDLAGIVLVFDSADGGMVAATMTTVQQWKTGSLSDSALWHNCFFDPPETFAASASSPGQ